ncbi:MULTISPECIES: serine/threonine-protein kinase [Nocardiopsis]|uniref:non-specific serine/threonine protein kinase n=1 Tax=Nocardiopsis sinuspersici TaxID=501010 RepID=A0A1V3C7W7_9ACTN|nr:MULTISPECIES: serine/threonine-protein kinase [Nocardiopsis]OOC56864.1 serine/threonine protein kinase [Nocardiopsis sinuspersici]
MSQPEAFGRYRVIRRLGSGSFATVWLAQDDLLNYPVAIKVLAENWAHQMDIQYRFLEEARILRQTDSTWLVAVHDVDVLPDGRPYMVMTYADQGSVADLVQRGQLPLDEVLRLLTEIGQGITVLHNHGTIHRDIKPSNVLLQSSPVGQRVLVADLGFAKSIDEASGFTAAAGTPGYMSPEQSIPGGDLDVRSDVYSLGAVAYELITGRPPSRPPVRIPPGRIRPGLPPALDELILSALSVDRESRPADAKTFTDRVRTIRMAPDLPQAVPWWQRYRMPWQRTAALLVSLAVLTGTVTASAGSPGLSLTTVRYATQQLRVQVPLVWAREFHTGREVYPAAGTGSEPEPGLLVATDADGWSSDDTRSYGVYATVVPDDRGLGGTGTGPCGSAPRERELDTGVWRGTVWEWPECAGNGSFSSAAVHQPGVPGTVYLEVRQPGYRPDLVDEIINGTSVN